MHYAKGRIKLEIGLAKGKRQYEKRDAQQERDWKRERSRLLKQRVKR
ncbi:MAG: SsrA-binding protein [Betaproteobacteria bacterium]